MFTVHLHKMKFFAHHGWQDEEGITGTEFEVSISITFEAKEKISSLHDTINYITVFDLVKERFLHPSRLLETLAEQIVQDIHQTDARIRTVNITIDKLNPPINNFTGTAGVSFTKSFI